MRWFLLELNPEPWAIGPVGYSRRGGKMSAYVGRNQQLDAFKESVRECLGTQDFFPGELELHFYFWRNRAEYKTAMARTHRKHEADLTNLQKATEDALQGVLFANDRDVKRVYSTIVEQGPDVIPAIAVGIQPYVEKVLPETVLELLDRRDSREIIMDDSWDAPDEGIF